MQETASLPAIHAQDLGPYPAPAPNCTVLSTVDGGHARGGAAGGGKSPADPAAQEELFVDESGTSAVWRSLGGQLVHTSFRSMVLGPSSVGHLHGGSNASSNGHGSIVQAVRCRFPTLLEGWSSKHDRKSGTRAEQQQQQKKRRRRGQWSVCILRNPDLVTVHHPSGHSYDVTLPCEARLLQPLGEGLLVQRFSGDADFATLGGEEEDASDAVPSLFTLRHPLDELRPVALLPPTMLGGGSAMPSPPLPAEDQQRLVCDASERVVFARGGGGAGGAGGVGRDASLLLTHHAGRRRHSLWLVLPTLEPELEPEPSQEHEPPLAGATLGDGGGGGDVSVLGALTDQSPGGFDSWRGTTRLSSTFAGDASSLSSTLLGVSALDSSSSAAGLSMIDAVLAAGHPRKERLSVGGSTRGGSAGRGRLSFGAAGRRASGGSNTSWIGAASTRNDALATALGLGKSALGVASNMLSLSATAGHGGGGERGPGTDPFLPTLAGGGLAAGTMAFGDSQALEDEEEGDEDDGVSQAIRPHLGLSLIWRETEDSPTPAQHVFCAATGTTERGAGSRSTREERDGSPSTEPFLLCLVEQDTARLRALSVSFAAADTREYGKAGCVEVAEAFTMPCRSAVGLCATTGGEGEGAPGGAIAADIVVLAPDGGLVLCRGEHPVTRVAIPQGGEPASAAGGSAQPESISDAIGSCFTLTTRSGNRRRLRLSLDPASPLVATCLGAWDCLLSSPLAASLRADVMCTARALAGQQGPASADSGGDSGGGQQRAEGNIAEDFEWAGLVSVLRSLILGVESATAGGQMGREGGSRGGLQVHGGREPDGGGGDDDADDADDVAWISLLSSPFHDQFSRDNAMLLSGLDREGVRKCEGSPGRRRRSARPSSPAPQTQRGTFLAEVGAAFDALHLVLEDLKTSRLTAALVPRLASLLLSLARLCGDAGSDMRDFADHYWRDAAGCEGGNGEAASMIARGEGWQRGSKTEGSILPSRPTSFRKASVVARVSHPRRPRCASEIDKF